MRCTVPTIHAVLGPHELRIASKAFRGALDLVDETAYRLSPHAARAALARYVVQGVSGGQRDMRKLISGALEQLKRNHGACGGAGRMAAPSTRHNLH